jgi:hypothetical protein
MTKRKLPLLGGGAIAAGLLAVMALADTRAQQQGPAAPDSVQATMIVDTASLQGPRQPIFFRHDRHAGQLKMQCQYCHYTVAVSPEPGLPTVQTCMGCHLVVGGTDSTQRTEIRKLREAWNEREPIEWQRIYAVGRHVHFPHNRHIAAMGPNACATCHGDVTRMPQVFQVQNVNNMGFCISCHVERDVSRDCTVCHY